MIDLIKANNNTLFVVDEAYVDFTAAPQSLLPYVDHATQPDRCTRVYKNVCRARIAYRLYGKSTRHNRPIAEVQNSWSVNSLALRASQYILENEEALRPDIGPLLNETAWLQQQINTIGKSDALPSATPFFPVKLHTGNSTALKQYLATNCAMPGARCLELPGAQRSIYTYRHAEPRKEHDPSKRPSRMDAVYLISIPLIAGYMADLLFGDPERLPHPHYFLWQSDPSRRKTLNHGGYRFAKGMLLTVVLIGSTYVFFSMAEYFLRQNDYALMAFRAMFVWFGMANRTLIEEGKAVFRKLRAGLEEGRQQLSRIVGRETKNLDGQQIRTAVFETVSENLSDGVIAPLFYYAIGGIPALMTYKMINTLDSSDSLSQRALRALRQVCRPAR